jgi:pSer/pThr/pTyr-binding forkhead associated (FHA) protein
VYHEGALVQSVLVDQDQNAIQLGRHQGCDVQLEHPVVSRMHAVITVLDADALYAGSAADLPGGALEIIDLGSSLGTRVNGALVERSVLHMGDTIEIGTFEVQINRRFGKPGAYRASLTTPLPPEAG